MDMEFYIILIEAFVLNIRVKPDEVTMIYIFGQTGKPDSTPASFLNHQ